jgi:hypothetical protein
MNYDAVENSLSEEIKIPDHFCANDKLKPAKGIGNGLILSLLILLPLIALVTWL